MTNPNWTNKNRWLPGGDKYEDAKEEQRWEKAKSDVPKIPRNMDKLYPDALHTDDHTPDKEGKE